MERSGQCQTHIPSCSGRPSAFWGPELPLRGCRRNSTRRLRAIVRAVVCQDTPARKLEEPSAEPCLHLREPTGAPVELCRPFRPAGVRQAPGLLDGRRTPAVLAGSVAALELLSVYFPEASQAGETLPVEVLGNLLDSVEQLGVFGPVAFVATVIGAEMVPLFPTQPLSIASGLLFGASKGSLLALTGTTTAAVLAFQLSRRLGRRLAERVIAEELTEVDTKKGMFAKVQTAIDSGSFQQQLVAVAVLRLTPIVPFSASNYLLGATPLQFSAYLAGSVFGLSFWCILFASLGGASRGVLKSGLSLETLYADLMAKAGAYTEDAALAFAGLGAATLVFYKLWPQRAEPSEEATDEKKHEDDFGKV